MVTHLKNDDKRIINTLIKKQNEATLRGELMFHVGQELSIEIFIILCTNIIARVY